VPSDQRARAGLGEALRHAMSKRCQLEATNNNYDDVNDVLDSNLTTSIAAAAAAAAAFINNYTVFQKKHVTTFLMIN